MSTQTCMPDFIGFGQSGLAFPRTLADQYQPQRIAEFCGLEKHKRVLVADGTL